jgi:hypothetical protein
MIKNSLLIALFLCSFTVVGQNSVSFKKNTSNDKYSSLEKNQIKDLYELYSLKLGSSYELVNGREYFPYYNRSKLKPILFIDRKHSSSITLRGRNYDNISLNYDTFSDEVIFNVTMLLNNNYDPYVVSLNKDNVDCFELKYIDDTLSFRYLQKVTNPGFDLQDGFYELVYNGKSKYIIKHKSSVYESDGVKEYSYTPVGYVNAGNGYVKIKSRGQFYRLFGDRSEDVRRFIKESGINIRRADKKQIMYVLNYFDSLKSSKKQSD